MSLCINPSCPKPQNLDHNLMFCKACGSELLLAKRYRVSRPLGGGGFIMTYEVFDRDTPKVLKILANNHPSALRLFQKEARVVKEINDPGIPKADKYFTFHPRNSSQPWHCLVIEYIEGQNLYQYLTQLGMPIDEKMALKWLKELTRILDILHQRNFVHQDIKPSNILVKNDGQLVLIDFCNVGLIPGIYGNKQRESEIVSMSYNGYIPLEELQFQTVPQSDFYALGRTFVYLLTGKEPEELYDSFKCELNWRFYAPQVSYLLADLLDEMMSSSPEKRPGNAQAILRRLAAIERTLYPTILRPQIVNTFTGHSEWITSLAVSPSGQILVSGCWDKTIKVWHLGNNKLIGTLTSHTDGVVSIALSRSGQIMVSGCWDKTIKIWQLGTGRLLGTLTGHTDGVLAVVISPSGKNLISGSGDNSIKIWHLGTGKLIRTLVGHTSWVKAIAISPDGETLVSGSYDKTINIWQLGTDKLKYQIIGHSAPITSLSISPDGQILASGSYDNTINIWNLNTGELISTLIGHANTVTSVDISHDGETLISGSDDKTVKIWQIKTGDLLCTLSGHSAAVTSVTASPDGQTVVSGSYDNTIKIWRLN